jgi:uncharacterized membrane protein
MTLKIFTLCDNAFFDKQNKLNVIGSFDTIMTNELPTHMLKMAVAVSVTDAPKNSVINLQFDIVDPTGKTSAAEQKIEVTNVENDTVNVIIGIPNLHIHQAGTYLFRLRSGEKELGHFPLSVHLAELTKTLES